jgi:hypothetical protein
MPQTSGTAKRSGLAVFADRREHDLDHQADVACYHHGIAATNEMLSVPARSGNPFSGRISMSISRWVARRSSNGGAKLSASVQLPAEPPKQNEICGLGILHYPMDDPGVEVEIAASQRQQ